MVSCPHSHFNFTPSSVIYIPTLLYLVAFNIFPSYPLMLLYSQTLVLVYLVIYLSILKLLYSVVYDKYFSFYPQSTLFIDFSAGITSILHSYTQASLLNWCSTTFYPSYPHSTLFIDFSANISSCLHTYTQVFFTPRCR